MSAALEPLLLAADSGHLFAAFHAPRAALRAGVLICPPILHEHALSYRLLALLGDALAAQGIAVLRFDYHGSGDSSGGENAFSLARAGADAERALAHLRQRTGAAPSIVLGVRAGALVAAELAKRAAIAQLWLWQPIVDGNAYLEELRARDLAERRSKIRYPEGGGLKDGVTDGSLMGFACAPEFFEQLGNARLGDDAASARVVLEPEGAEPAVRAAERIALPASVSAWSERVDMGHFPLPPVREVASRLAGIAGAA